MLKKVKSKELGVRSEKNFIFCLFSFSCFLCSVFCLLSLAHASIDNGSEINLAQADTSAATDSTGTDQVPPDATSPDSAADAALSEDTEEDEDANSSLSQLTQSPLVGNSGVAKKNIPIIVPQGRKGIEPRISLNYNSNSQNGWLGIGWTLDMGAIQRETRWGLDYSSNQFNFVINNLLSRLVPRVGWGANYYEAKIESEFSKYYYDTASKGWIVTAKDGTKYYYGSAPASRQYDPADPNKIFKWCLDKVQDTNGNYMLVTYWKDNNEIYLNEIKYTGNSNTSHDPVHKVTFIPDNGTTRLDAPIMYAAHFTVKTRYRLKTIEVRSDNRLVRKYELSYTPSDTISRSLLSGVQEFDSDGVTALPKISNAYYTENDGSFLHLVSDSRLGELDETWQVAFTDVNGDKQADAVVYYIGQVGSQENGKGVKLRVALSDGGAFGNYISSQDVTSGYGTGWKLTFADVDGDGMADAIANYIGHSNGASLEVALSNGDGTFGAFIQTEVTGHATGWKFAFADVNGDGKTDAIAYRIGNAEGSAKLEVALSNGDSGTFGNFLLSLDVAPDYGTGWKFAFADVNGDGRTDAIAYRIGNAEGSAKLRVALASATEEGKFGNLEISSQDQMTGFATGWKFAFADVNGDGMADAVANYRGQGDGAKVKVKLSKGDGKFEDNFQLTTLATSGYGSPWKFTFADINGDGTADAVAYKLDGYTRRVDISLSNGDGTFAGFVSSNQDVNYSWGHSSYSYGYGFADINGDGKTDSMNFTLLGSSFNGIYIDTYLATGDTGSNLLKANDNGLGGTTEIVYTPSSAYNNSYLPFVQQTVSQVTITDGRENSSVTTFDYSGGFYSIAQKEFRGFEYVKSTAPTGTVTASWFKQDDVFRGFIEAQTVEDSSSNIYTSIENTYDSTIPYTGVDYPYLSRIDNYIYDGNNNNDPRHIINQFTYDDYGNIESRYYAEDPSQDDEKTEFTTYYQDGEVGSYLVSLPKRTCVSNVLITNCNDNNANIKARDMFTYYSTTGNLNTKTSWLNTGGTNPVTTYTYDPYGNVATITDPNQNLLPENERKRTIITYDALTRTFPEDITNPLEHNIHKTYDLVFVDRVRSERDPNSNTTTYDYDEFERIKTITKPAPYGVTKYFYPDLINPDNLFGTANQHIREEAQNGAGALIHFKETYFDGLERTRTEKQGGPNARTVIVDTGYNEKGLVDTKTYPYFDGDTPYEILYFYDPVDRLEYTYNPDNASSSIAYDRGWITYIDANNHKKEQKKDIYNRNVTVIEYTGNSSSNYVPYATTAYWYDVLNNLETVVDAKGNPTEITYDSLSRKIAMDDPDMGDWTYTYDANGNLKTQTDARNYTITFTYDPLNRVTLKNYPTGTDVVYTYDETLYTNPKGRLTTLTDSSGITKSNYDSMGQITSSIKTIGTDTYTTQTQYDPLGRVKKIIYPDSAAVDYTYDGNGNVKDIKSGTTTYADYNSYTAVGDPLSIDYGNDKVNSTYQYIPQNNRLYSLTTNSVTQGGLINISYNYDSVGNIRILSDSLTPSRTRMYTYDDLDRLIDANSQMYDGYLVYSYDKIGNMTYNCRKGNYEYDSDHPHAVKRIKNSNGVIVESYIYDANGNMTSRVGKTLTYNYDNMPTRINYGSTYVDSVYDALGNRVTKTVSGQATTKYVGQLYECTSGVCTKYIFAGTKRIAQVKGTDTYYYHTDHLESSTVITDQNGNKVEELLYYPFGEIFSDSSPTKVKYKFAGHELDSETQLIYMKARYYDPKLARFVSADPVVPVRVELYNFRDFTMSQFRQLSNPQALNRYSYVVNNPIVFRDPLGLAGKASWVNYVSTGLGIGSAVAGTVALAVPVPASKAVAAGFSGATAGFSYWANQTGRMSDSEASRNIGLAATDLAGVGLEARGYINLGNLVSIISRALGITNTGYDAAKAAGEKIQVPGPNPIDATKINNPANATKANIDNNAASKDSMSQTVQAQTESPKKPANTESVSYFNYFGFLQQQQSNNSWSMLSNPNSGSSGTGGGAGFISPPAAGHPGN